MAIIFENEVGFLADVDGTIAETPHEECWRLAAEECGVPKGKFTSKFYQRRVAGILGDKGARAILKNFGDPYIFPKMGRITSADLKKIKQGFLDDYIEKGKFDKYPDAINLLIDIKKYNGELGVVSPSKNAEKILKRIDINGKSLYELFDSHTLGIDTNTKKDLYLKAADDLKEKQKSLKYFIVFEDADKGIIGAKEAGFFVIARSYITTPEHLYEIGADIAATSFNELNYEKIRQIFSDSCLSR